MKRIEIILIIAILAAIAFIVCGCQEEQKIWGRGELPVDYQEFFGNDNTARLDFRQNRVIDRNSEILYGMNTEDPNGQAKHKRGLIERITALEDRVKKLERRTSESIAKEFLGKDAILLGVDPNE